jgi:hypothetical protein
MKFEVDMGEWSTSWRFHQKAYEYHENVESQLPSWQNKQLKTKLSLKPIFFFPKQKPLWHDRQTVSTEVFSFGTTVFSSCKRATDQNTDSEWQCNKT